MDPYHNHIIYHFTNELRTNDEPNDEVYHLMDPYHNHIIYHFTNELRTNDERHLALNISNDEPYHNFSKTSIKAILWILFLCARAAKFFFFLLLVLV